MSPLIPFHRGDLTNYLQRSGTLFLFSAMQVRLSELYGKLPSKIPSSHNLSGKKYHKRMLDFRRLAQKLRRPSWVGQLLISGKETRDQINETGISDERRGKELISFRVC